MVSESARMTTAKEASFRIDAPNSKPRAVKVIALDGPSIAIVDGLAQREWKGATFFRSVAAEWDPQRHQAGPVAAGLIDLAGKRHDLVDEIGAATLVVMISTAGESGEAASLIADVCSLKRVMITGLLITNPASSDDEVTRTLQSLRPYAPMLVISGEEDYIEAMLRALRA